eukprot:2388613-Rhodomonas_salina.2
MHRLKTAQSSNAASSEEFSEAELCWRQRPAMGRKRSGEMESQYAAVPSHLSSVCAPYSDTRPGEIRRR